MKRIVKESSDSKNANGVSQGTVLPIEKHERRIKRLGVLRDDLRGGPVSRGKQ